MVYSVEIKNKVLEILQNNITKPIYKIAEENNVEPATLKRWIKELNIKLPNPEERRLIERKKVIEENPNLNLTQLARKFGISKKALKYFIKKHNLNVKK